MLYFYLFSKFQQVVNYNFSYTAILPISQVQAQQLLTSQIRSCIKYSVPTMRILPNILVLLLRQIWRKTVSAIDRLSRCNDRWRWLTFFWATMMMGLRNSLRWRPDSSDAFSISTRAGNSSTTRSDWHQTSRDRESSLERRSVAMSVCVDDASMRSASEWMSNSSRTRYHFAYNNNPHQPASLFYSLNTLQPFLFLLRWLQIFCFRCAWVSSYRS